jgi:hypothetical protein
VIPPGVSGADLAGTPRRFVPFHGRKDEAMKKRKPQACSRCGEAGHTKRTCPQGKAGPAPAAKAVGRAIARIHAGSADEVVVRVRIVVSVEQAR